VTADTVTNLINALPGNSSVNKIQHAVIGKSAFSASAVTSRSGEWSRDMFPVMCVRSSAIQVTEFVLFCDESVLERRVQDVSL
jgi:hypothetical protein